MAFEIEYSTKAIEQLKKLDKPTAIQILKALKKISENPFLAKPLSNVFKNYRSEHAGKYKIVFSIKGNTLIIAKMERRKTAYDTP
jgi:mRNA-degrading endonuclease RelE of RelBE toxin-antitoxin system